MSVCPRRPTHDLQRNEPHPRYVGLLVRPVETPYEGLAEAALNLLQDRFLRIIRSAANLA
jgi:hypothetical protein